MNEFSLHNNPPGGDIATRILIVEDDVDTAQLLERVLFERGYEILGPVDSGPAALRMLAAETVHLVLMDILIRGDLDGVETANRIHLDYDIPIVYLTAQDDDEVLERVKHAPSFGYVVKPFRRAELFGAIELAVYKHATNRQLVEKEHWLEITLSSVAQAVVTVDGDRRITYLNPAAMALTGWSREEARGRPYRDVVWLADEVGTYADTAVTGDARLLSRNGVERYVEFRISPITDSPRRMFGAVIVLNDVTERRAMLEELRGHRDRLQQLVAERTADLERARDAAEAAARAKSLFLANMSHELRTPLNSIIGFSRLIQLPEDDREQRELLAFIHQAGKQLLKVINDILDISKIDSGHAGLRPTELDCLVLARNCASLLRVQVESKGVALTLEHPDAEPPVVYADEGRLQQVVLNLVTNAIKFTPEGGRITLRVFSRANQAVIEVADTGIGIPEAHLAAIFEAFAQVEGGQSADSGAGLGLAIARRIVEAHHGVLFATSRLGEGSVFTVQLPLRAKAGAVETTAATRSEAGLSSYPPHLREKRILVVDDDTNSRRVLEMFFQKNRQNFGLCSSGAECLAELERAPAVLILTDIRMPGMDGVELAEAVRTRYGIPVIAITAAPPAADDVETSAESARCFSAILTKPLDLELLVNTMSRIPVD